MSKKLLFIVNSSDFFISHRLQIALAAQRKGYQVLVASGDNASANQFSDLGIEHRLLPLSRSGRNPFKEIKLIAAIYSLLRDVRPDIIHNVTIKPVLYGALINRLSIKVRCINAIPGLGYNFTRSGLKAKILQIFLLCLYRQGLKGNNTKTIFQNKDDLNYFLANKVISPEDVFLINGSGVCLQTFSSIDEPKSEPIKVLFPARLLKDKGVVEYVAAAKILSSKHNVIFLLAGDIDQGNPSTIDQELLEKWQTYPFISWLGFLQEMADCYQNIHIVCLPSYREGMPKALLEAQACGRPVVTTDVPGCRDAISHGQTGFLVPPREIVPLTNALEKLITDSSLRHAMGKKARKRACNLYSINSVIDKTLALYE